MVVRTRFAPSPTGMLHIGGARTALFSWLHARKHGGHFILRVEDTDRERSTAESVQAILDGMQWLGLAYDEGPYYQTQRAPRYQTLLEKLLTNGDAYKCYCSRERLDALREEQLARKQKPRYDGRCRDSQEPPPDGVEPAIRFRNPRDGEVVVDDLIRGRIVFRNEELDDLIIARSDGTPTYNFSVVVDDYEMAITHVIRGDDHINNTPRQMNIMRALGTEPPWYAHVPMILGEDGKRLSKRHGAVSVMQYRDDGYLPEALLNYLARLSWSHGDQEVFSPEELIEKFEIGDVHRSAATFNPGKLLWLNHHYLMRGDPENVAEHLRWHLETRGVDLAVGPGLADVVVAQRERCKTLVEMAEKSQFFYQDFDEYEPKAAQKNLKPGAAEPLTAVRAALEELDEWTAERIHEAVTEVAESLELKLGKVAQPLRVAISGGAVSPPIDQTLALLSQERALARIDRALHYVEAHGG